MALGADKADVDLRRIPVVCPSVPVGSAGIIGVMIKVFILTFEALCVLSLVCVITLTSLSLGV